MNNLERTKPQAEHENGGAEKFVAEEAERREENLEVDAEGTIQTAEEYPLNEVMREMVRDYFEKRGFLVVEISDTHVKVAAPSGKKMAIPNKTAIETAAAK